MKHQILWSAIMLATATLGNSCQSEQKPSDRISVWEDDSNISLSSNVVEVPFQRTAGNLAEVKVSLNGVTFNMWWDTGASMTCISALELQNLCKEGRISLDDYQGRILSRIADGSSTESFVFNIKEIYIQGLNNQYLRLQDIDAMVSPNQDAPLLIGQNIIQNLPPHKFREDAGVIEFEK
ncbi:MAG: hypothetical protein HDR46_05235 [Bacteroides sp.]|nr:hypothetical protein [Bacteroides sp.]